MKRIATMQEIKDLAKGVKADCIFCARQTNKYDALDFVDDCKAMIESFAEEYIISKPVYDYLWNKIDRVFAENF